MSFPVISSCIRKIIKLELVFVIQCQHEVGGLPTLDVLTKASATLRLRPP